MHHLIVFHQIRTAADSLRSRRLISSAVNGLRGWGSYVGRMRPARTTAAGSVTDESSDPLLIVVHGTTAGEPSASPGAWWHSESDVMRRLSQDFADETNESLRVRSFLWSGANSERSRRYAAMSLARMLTELEATQRPYHLLGHSHGGSVIWSALCRGMKDGRQLRGLRSWTTIGTPFLHFEAAAPSEGWLISLFAAVIVTVVLWPWYRRFAMHASDLWIDRPAEVTAGLLLLLGPLVLLAGLGRTSFWAIRVAQCASWRRSAARAYARYGPRHLCLWSVYDEAMAVLRLSVGSPVAPLTGALFVKFPSSTPTHNLGLFAFARFLYSYLMARLGDEIVWSVAARRTQGADLAGLKVVSVEPSPFGSAPAAMPEAIETEVLEHANLHAGRTLAATRMMLRDATADARSLGAVLLGQVTWGELVHTAYVRLRSIRALIVHHLVANRFAAPGSRKTAETEDSPAPCGRPEVVPRPDRLIPVFVHLSVVVMIGLSVLASIPAVNAVLAPYTVEYYVAAISASELETASVTAGRWGASEFLHGDHGPLPPVALWLKGLTQHGKLEAAAAFVTDHLDKPDSDPSVPYSIENTTVGLIAILQGGIPADVVRSVIENLRRRASRFPEDEQRLRYLLAVVHHVHPHARRAIEPLIEDAYALTTRLLSSVVSVAPAAAAKNRRLLDLSVQSALGLLAAGAAPPATALASAIADAADRVGIRTPVARLFMGLGRFTDSLDLVRSSTAIPDEDTDAILERLARELAHRAQFGQAFDALTRISTATSRLRAVSEVALVARAQGRSDVVSALAADFTPKDPTGPEARDDLLKIAVIAGDRATTSRIAALSGEPGALAVVKAVLDSPVADPFDAWIRPVIHGLSVDTRIEALVAAAAAHERDGRPQPPSPALGLAIQRLADDMVSPEVRKRRALYKHPRARPPIHATRTLRPQLHEALERLVFEEKAWDPGDQRQGRDDAERHRERIVERLVHFGHVDAALLVSELDWNFDVVARLARALPEGRRSAYERAVTESVLREWLSRIPRTTFDTVGRRSENLCGIAAGFAILGRYAAARQTAAKCLITDRLAVDGLILRLLAERDGATK